VGGALIIVISPAELSDIAGKMLQYSGAFLRVNDHNRAKNYLQSYKPFGLLRERIDFKNEEDYQKYIQDFTNISYEAEIRDFTQADISLIQMENTVLGSLPLTIIMVLCFILTTVVSFSNQDIRDTIITRVKNGENTNSIRQIMRNSILIVVFLACLFYIFTLLFNIAKSRVYCPVLSYMPIIAVTLGVMLVFGVVFSGIFVENAARKYTG
jgi:hypothetical protein